MQQLSLWIQIAWPLLLGLLPRSEYRGRDRKMIGNRGLQKENVSILVSFPRKAINSSRLCYQTYFKIEQLNSKIEVGFREEICLPFYRNTFDIRGFLKV